MAWQQRYLDRFYDRDKGWVDGTTRFHEVCAAAIPAGARILEVGAGPSNKTSRYLAGLGEVHGIDLDADVLTNDALTTATVLDGSFPYEPGSFDACVSNFVVEHVAEPHQHLAEIARVLKPGAPYVLRTPNRWHYVYLVASLTPHRLHLALANRLRNLPPNAHDPYPTVYAMNSRREVCRAAADAGMSVELLQLIEPEPSYGLGSRLTFLPFVAYERLVNSSEMLSGLRSTILAVLTSD